MAGWSWWELAWYGRGGEGDLLVDLMKFKVMDTQCLMFCLHHGSSANQSTRALMNGTSEQL